MRHHIPVIRDGPQVSPWSCFWLARTCHVWLWRRNDSASSHWLQWPDTTPKIVPIRFTTSCSHTRGHSQKCRCWRSVSLPDDNDFDSRVDRSSFLSPATTAAPNIRTHTHTPIWHDGGRAKRITNNESTTARPGVAYTSRNRTRGCGLARWQRSFTMFGWKLRSRLDHQQ